MRKSIPIAVLAVLSAFAASPPLGSGTQKATILGRILDAGTGQVMPATVIIQTSDHSVVIEAPNFTRGFYSDGRFEKHVPAGPTTITVRRGFDYLAEQRRLDLRPGQRVELTFRLSRQANLRRAGWYCGDNHVHMTHGEAKLTVDFADVARAARAAGLDYLSIAQAWNLPAEQITPAGLQAACRSVSTPDFALYWNMEAPKNYWRGDVTHCLGHGWTLGMGGETANGENAIEQLFQMSAHDYESEKTPAPNFESQALIHALGGIVAYTHPCRWWWGKWGGQGVYPVETAKFVSNLAQELPYDTVVGPTYDALDILMQPGDQDNYRQAQRLWFLLLEKGYRIAGTASTDSTFDNPGSANPGAVRVYTHVEGSPDAGALARAMRAGQNLVTSGPLLLLQIGGHSVGDVIPIPEPAEFRVNLQAYPSGAVVGERLTKVELIRNGKIIKSLPVGDGKREFSAEFRIRERETAWYIARCFGSDDLQVAMTNPIYFEGRDYRPPLPTLARVTGVVTDEKTGKPLDGECETVRMVGLTPVLIAKHPFQEGRFTLEVPGTARLRVQAPGYHSLMKSVFMDYPPLLRLTLDMRGAELIDAHTFEEIKGLLRDVRLEFPLAPAN